ncbi:hypothetical protein [Chamaesiphon sp. OTE_75_metabat_556]|uniref:hypothetical protein n=1 Tax=Chamaesiphon sp. OTE_75_metabat_556 TaxID=2964692 RepID=UPI00286C0762|nr:hypothetical protein [Chamaesiphon sp. OTE_75_metabat_556]
MAKKLQTPKKVNADLTLEHVGKTDINTRIANVDTKFTQLEGKIHTVEAKLEGKIDKVDAKYEERTKLGFWGFIFRGTALAALAALMAVFVKYLFPILPSAPRL